jgi:hypothetical protein
VKLHVPPAKLAAATYKALLPTVMTTFELGHYVNGELTPGHLDARDFIARMPFASFAVREPFTFAASPASSGIETILLSRLEDQDAVTMVSKIEYRDPQRGFGTLYAPHDDNDHPFSSATTVQRLYAALYSRRFRFVETPVNRHDRRMAARPAGYREYILVGPESARYATALRPSKIVKRLRALHAVHRFMRHVRNDGCPELCLMHDENGDYCYLCESRVVPVRAHERGSDEALQVKTYRLPAASVCNERRHSAR